MTVYGQRQQLGIPTPELSTVARNYHRDYLEIILRPRVAMASRGCTEADAALTAFIEYARWRQVAGLGEDPEVVPCGVDWIVPQRLVDLYVRLCFREAHAFCVRDRRLPGLHRVHRVDVRAGGEHAGRGDLTGAPDLAHGYLKRCGRYRVTVLSDDIDEDPDDFERKERYGLEIALEWTPGPGAFGICSTA